MLLALYVMHEVHTASAQFAARRIHFIRLGRQVNLSMCTALIPSAVSTTCRSWTRVSRIINLELHVGLQVVDHKSKCIAVQDSKVEGIVWNLGGTLGENGKDPHTGEMLE